MQFYIFMHNIDPSKIQKFPHDLFRNLNISNLTRYQNEENM